VPVENLGVVFDVETVNQDIQRKEEKEEYEFFNKILEKYSKRKFHTLWTFQIPMNDVMDWKGFVVKQNADDTPNVFFEVKGMIDSSNKDLFVSFLDELEEESGYSHLYGCIYMNLKNRNEIIHSLLCLGFKMVNPLVLNLTNDFVLLSYQL